MAVMSIPTRGKQRDKALAQIARQRGQKSADHVRRTWERWEALLCPICGKPIADRAHFWSKPEELAELGITEYAQEPEDGSVHVHAVCLEERIEAQAKP